MKVLFEPARSAEPPHSSGNTGAIALSTWPEAARVAMALSSSKVGSAASQPSGRRLSVRRSSSAAPSGLAAFHASKRASQCARYCATRCAARSRTWETRVGVGVEHLSGVGTQGYLQTREGLAAEL